MATSVTEKLIGFHASLTVSEELLQRLISLYEDEGWRVNRLSLETRDQQTINCDSLDELKNLPDDIWHNAKILRVNAVKMEDKKDAHSCLILRRDSIASFDKPLWVFISCGRADIVLMDRLKNFITANKEWYSPLSRESSWLLLFFLLFLINVTVEFLFHRTLLGIYFLPVLLPMLLIILASRHWFFPSIVFNFGAAARKHGVTTKQRSLLAKTLGGLIVTALTIVLGIAINRTLNSGEHIEHPQQNQSPNDGGYQTKPLPDEVIGEIDRHPFLAQTQIARSYTNQRVKWVVELQDAELRDATYYLTLLDRGHYPWIYCSVGVAEHPELKMPKIGQEMRVRGKISAVLGNTIKLDECGIEVAP